MNMPNTVDIQRHKLNQSMYQKLKRYIMSKRRRELEEQAQDAHLKKLRREKEERKRQAELDTKNLRSTLDSTKNEILVTSKKIEDLKTQRNELFHRWKELRNEEEMHKEKQRSEAMNILSSMPTTPFGLPESPSITSQPSGVVTGSLGPNVHQPHHQLSSCTSTVATVVNKPVTTSLGLPSGGNGVSLGAGIGTSASAPHGISLTPTQQHYQQQKQQQQLHHMHPQHFLVGKDNAIPHRPPGVGRQTTPVQQLSSSTGAQQSSYQIILPPNGQLGKGQQPQQYHHSPQQPINNSATMTTATNNSNSYNSINIGGNSSTATISTSLADTISTIALHSNHAAVMAAVAAAIAATSQRSPSSTIDPLLAYINALASSSVGSATTTTAAAAVTSSSMPITCSGVGVGYLPSDPAAITALATAAAAGFYQQSLMSAPNSAPASSGAGGSAQFLFPTGSAGLHDQAVASSVFSGGPQQHHRSSPASAGETGSNSVSLQAARGEEGLLSMSVPTTSPQMTAFSSAAAAAAATFSKQQQQQAMVKSLRHHSVPTNAIDHQHQHHHHSQQHHNQSQQQQQQQVAPPTSISGCTTPTTGAVNSQGQSGSTLLPPAPIGYRGSITTGQSAQQIQMQQQKQQQQQQHLMSKYVGSGGGSSSATFGGQQNEYPGLRTGSGGGGATIAEHAGSRLSETVAFMAAAAEPYLTMAASQLHGSSGGRSQQQPSSTASPVAFPTVLPPPYSAEMSQLSYFTTATLAAAAAAYQQQQKIATPTSNTPSPISRASPAGPGGSSVSNTPSATSAGSNGAAPRRFF